MRSHRCVLTALKHGKVRHTWVLCIASKNSVCPVSGVSKKFATSQASHWLELKPLIAGGSAGKVVLGGGALLPRGAQVTTTLALQGCTR